MRHLRRPPPIAIEELDHGFGEGDAREQVQFSITLTIERGELTVLSGPSGSGKTTLLTLIGCLRQVQSGSIRLFGQELSGAPEANLIRARRQLGFIFQAHNLRARLTATQNVRMGLEVQGAAAMVHWEKAPSHLLGLLGLGNRLDYLPAHLSGGQKQRDGRRISEGAEAYASGTCRGALAPPSRAGR